MATTAPSWFNESVYMANKLKQLQASEPDANWTEASMAKAFVDAGYGADNVYQHFLEHGKSEDISPVSEFNVSEYYTAKAMEFYKLPEGTMPTALQYETIKNLIHEVYPEGGAWEHYDKHGMEEGINPSNGFDVSGYMEAKLALMVAKDSKYTMEQLVTAFEENGYTPLSHYLTYKGQTGEVAKDEKFDVPADEKVTPPAGAGETGQTFTLTDKVEVLTGTANNDTFIAGAGTIQAGDSINGGDGIDTLKIYEGQSTTGLTTTSVENVIFNGLKGDASVASTSDFAGMTGVQNIVIDGYAGAAVNHTFSNLNDGVTVTLKGAITDTSGKALTFDFDTKGGIALDNMSAGAAIGAAFVNISDSLKELTVSGTSAMNAGIPRAVLSLNGAATSSLEKLVVNSDKDGFIAMDVNTAFDKLATIDASGSKGQTRFDIEQVTSTKIAVTGGEGDDTLRLKAGQLTGVTFDGGLGHDRAVVMFSGAATDAQYALLNKLGVEEVIFEGVANHPIDAGKLDAHYIGLEDANVVNNIAADDFIVHSREDGDGNTPGFTLNTAVGNDTVNLILENSLTALASANAINVNSVSSFKILNITGDGTQDLTYTGTGNTRGDLTINGKDYAGKMTITVGSGDDTITVGSGGSTITGGAGNDKITLGAGVDTIVISQAAGGPGNNVTALNGMDTVSGFQTGAGGDKINVGNFLTQPAAAGGAAATTKFDGTLTTGTSAATAVDNTTYLLTYDGTIGSTAKDLHSLAATDLLSEFFGAGKAFALAQGAGVEFGLMITDASGKAMFVMIDVNSDVDNYTNSDVEGKDMFTTLQLTGVEGTGFTADNFVIA